MTTRKNRPRTVTITLLGVILLGVWNAARAFALAREADFLLSLGIRPDPRLLLVIAAAWALLFSGLALAILLKYAFTRWLVPLSILVYALYELLLQAMFVRTPVNEQSWLLRLLLSVAAVIFALWALNQRSAISYLVSKKPASIVEDKE
jgi:polyferredoxin